MKGRYEIWAVKPQPQDSWDDAVFLRYGPTLEDAFAYVEAHARDRAYYDEHSDTFYTQLAVVEGGTW